MFKWLNDWFNPFSWIKYFTQKPTNQVYPENNTTTSTSTTGFESREKNEENQFVAKSVRPESKHSQFKTTNSNSLDPQKEEIRESEDMLAAIRIDGYEDTKMKTAVNTSNAPTKQNKNQQAVTSSTTEKPQQQETKKGKGALHKLTKEVSKLNPFNLAADQKKLKNTMNKASKNFGKAGQNLKDAGSNIEDANQLNKEQQTALNRKNGTRSIGR